MKVEYDVEIEEWIATLPDQPQLGEFFGDSALSAKQRALEALRVWADAQRKLEKDVETVIVTRHVGLVEWLALRGITGKTIVHATEDDVRGKRVVGALPMHLAALAAEIVVVDMPRLVTEQRGLDLTPAEMDAAGASLSRYQVRPA